MTKRRKKAVAQAEAVAQAAYAELAATLEDLGATKESIAGTLREAVNYAEAAEASLLAVQSAVHVAQCSHAVALGKRSPCVNATILTALMRSEMHLLQAERVMTAAAASSVIARHEMGQLLSVAERLARIWHESVIGHSVDEVPVIAERLRRAVDAVSTVDATNTEASTKANEDAAQLDRYWDRTLRKCATPTPHDN